jgi:hypothetical protein
MWMMGLSLTYEQVQGIDDAMGWKFRGLFGETPVLGLFTTGSLMNTTLKIWLTSSPKNKILSGSRWRTDRILFLCSNGCISSSSLESYCAGAFFFYGSRPELGPAPASLSFFFSSSVGRI